MCLVRGPRAYTLHTVAVVGDDTALTCFSCFFSHQKESATKWIYFKLGTTCWGEKLKNQGRSGPCWACSQNVTLHPFASIKRCAIEIAFPSVCVSVCPSVTRTRAATKQRTFCRIYLHHLIGHGLGSVVKNTARNIHSRFVQEVVFTQKACEKKL